MTESQNLAVVSEILLFEPWLHRHGTPEREQIWKPIGKALTKFKNLDDRSVRDHYKLLEKKFNKKISNEEKATGIAPPEESELDQGIRSIIEQFHDFDSKRMEEKHQKELKTSKDTEIAGEFRKASLETFGETKRRLSVETGDDFTSPKQKKGKSSSETFSYLQEKNEQELAVRKEELEIRKREMEERQRFNDQMQKLLIRQQNHTTDLFEQQQQISNAFLNFMNKFASSS